MKTKKLLILLCLILLTSCAARQKIEKITAPEIKPVLLTVTDVNMNRNTFNPAEGENVTISFRVSKPSKIIIKIFDPEMRLVKDMVSESPGDSEINNVIWDGKDMEGRVVPDEAYFFTIEAMDYEGNFVYYDPTTISGGEYFIPDGINYDKTKGLISYKLFKDARVKIRAGIASDGPLLNNIIDWRPRPSGLNEEPWNGKEASGVVDITELKDYRLVVETITLPENSIITSGNSAHDYFEYKNILSPERPEKEKRPLFQNEMTLLGRQTGVLDRRGPEPVFRIELPKSKAGGDGSPPVVNGKISVKIYLDDKIKRLITEQRYEIIFFVDLKFVTEAEEGYSPFTLYWDTRDVNNGEHIITVNVATISGQVSSGSIKVMVQN